MGADFAALFRHRPARRADAAGERGNKAGDGPDRLAGRLSAFRQAAAQGIAAKEVTPFLLDRIYTLTQGRSLAANIALVLNNARLAAGIAAALAE